MKIKWFYLAGVGLVLVSFIVGLLVVVPRLSGKPAAIAQVETPIPPYLEGLEEKMFDPAVDAQGRQSLAEKIEMYKLAQSVQIAGAAAPAAKDPSAVQIPALADSVGEQVLPSGIYVGSDGMVKPEEGNIRNYLQRQEGDGTILVIFAGSSAQDEQEGLLILMSYNAALDVVEYQHYLHATKAGALTILADEGTRIKLQAANETIWYFDLTTRSITQESPYLDMTRP